jgi:hypothetical protein
MYKLVFEDGSKQVFNSIIDIANAHFNIACVSVVVIHDTLDDYMEMS